MLDKINLFGIGITNASKEEVLEYIRDSLKKPSKKYFIVTPNPELVMIASKSPSYKTILNTADLALVDGVGLLLASRFLGRPLTERITGVDFMLDLCKWSSKKPITVGLLGGRPGVAEKVKECLQQKFPELKVSFAVGELSELKSNSKVDILFVAFGSPKQEEWIAQNIDSLPVHVVMGVGGAFDFISGTVPRAPKVLQNFGLEWLYRLILQPWRIKRQLALIEFLMLTLKEKFSPH